MTTSQFILEGYCKGSYPVDGIQDLLDEPWLARAIQHIKDKQQEKAVHLISEHFTAEFVSSNISGFEANEIRFLRTLSSNFSPPAIASDEFGEFPIFKWIGAHFLMEGPTSIVSGWLTNNEDGKKVFSQQRFDNWLSDKDPLQDGCIYHLGPCWYDLDGFGTNGCSIMEDSVILGFDQAIDTESLYLLNKQEIIAAQKKTFLESLPSQTPLTGENLLFINALMEEECPSEERRPERFDVAEKWARLAGYTNTTRFYEALLDAMGIDFG